MKEIADSRKVEGGIEVFWDDAGKRKHEIFSYEKLIEIKINALDLLDNPSFYKIDEEHYTIHLVPEACCRRSGVCSTCLRKF